MHRGAFAPTGDVYLFGHVFRDIGVGIAVLSAVIREMLLVCRWNLLRSLDPLIITLMPPSAPDCTQCENILLYECTKTSAYQQHNLLATRKHEEMRKPIINV